jgi:hypothetical protein
VTGWHRRGIASSTAAASGGPDAKLVADGAAVVSGSAHHDVIADPREAAGQQVAVAHDVGQILMQSQILMES